MYRSSILRSEAEKLPYKNTVTEEKKSGRSSRDRLEGIAGMWPASGICRNFNVQDFHTRKHWGKGDQTFQKRLRTIAEKLIGSERSVLCDTTSGNK